MRRKRKSTLQLLSELPWWVSLALAASVYLLPLLLKLLIADVSMDTPATSLGQIIRQAVLQVIPLFAQILAPLFCLIAVFSAIQSWRKGTLFRSRTNLQSIRNLSWQDFERYIAKVYRQQGYSVEETGLGGADGGVDLIAKKEGEVFLVQCKNWRNRRVGVRVARELFGLVKAHGAAGGILVISGEFTAEARKFSKQTKLDLIDGKRLISLISRVKDIASAPLDEGATQSGAGAPNCPRCNAPMVGRTAKKGRDAGKEFWGCTQFPSCRGTRERAPVSSST